MNILLQSLYGVCIKNCYTGCRGGKPIRIAVPVNLRPYFDSDTTKNFFVMVSAEFRPERVHTFEESTACIQSSLHSQINKEHDINLFSLQWHPTGEPACASGAVIFEKYCHAYRMRKIRSGKYDTITNICNIRSKIFTSPIYRRFFGFYSHVKRAAFERKTICSYQDTLVFNIQFHLFRGSGTEGIFPQDCGGWCGCGD